MKLRFLLLGVISIFLNTFLFSQIPKKLPDTLMFSGDHRSLILIDNFQLPVIIKKDTVFVEKIKKVSVRDKIQRVEVIVNVKQEKPANINDNSPVQYIPYTTPNVYSGKNIREDNEEGYYNINQQHQNEYMDTLSANNTIMILLLILLLATIILFGIYIHKRDHTKYEEPLTKKNTDNIVFHVHGGSSVIDKSTHRQTTKNSYNTKDTEDTYTRYPDIITDPSIITKDYNDLINKKGDEDILKEDPEAQMKEKYSDMRDDLNEIH